MVKLLEFDYYLMEAQNAFRNARNTISHSLLEDAGVLLGVIHEYLPATYEMVRYYIPNDGRGDWIVDHVSSGFAKFNDRRFEIENLASRLRLLADKSPAPKQSSIVIKPIMFGRAQEENAAHIVDSKTGIKDLFKFAPGQILFDNKDLNLPTGETVEICKKLIENFGHTVPYPTFNKKLFKHFTRHTS
jgi:hypothetical protein